MKNAILAQTGSQHQKDVSTLCDLFVKAQAEGAALVVKAKLANDTSAMDKAHAEAKKVLAHIKPADFAAVVQVIGRLSGAADELKKA